MHGGPEVLLGLVWGLLGLALLTLAVVTIIWLIRQMTAQAQRPARDPAVEELRRRFASGQIDQEEYQRRREQLRE